MHSSAVCRAGSNQSRQNSSSVWSAGTELSATLRSELRSGFVFAITGSEAGQRGGSVCGAIAGNDSGSAGDLTGGGGGCGPGSRPTRGKAGGYSCKQPDRESHHRGEQQEN